MRKGSSWPPVAMNRDGRRNKNSDSNRALEDWCDALYGRRKIMCLIIALDLCQRGYLYINVMGGLVSETVTNQPVQDCVFPSKAGKHEMV